MKGDFSRDTFDPAKHFSRVLMQQGRVQLDADFNEQVAILLHHIRALTADILGPAAGPVRDAGFGVVDFDSLDPKEQERLKALKRQPAAGDFLIGKGRYYVDGMLIENDDYTLYRQQPDMPELAKLENRTYLVYVEAWERLITAVEDDSIREVALGGPDTAARARIVWQVKAEGVSGDRCDNITPAWATLVDGWRTTDRATLKAQTRPDDDTTDPCITPPESRYRGVENQLYRVEIHAGGDFDAATFKWSRENGSVVFPIVAVQATVAEKPQLVSVTLGSLGRDSRLSLAEGDWVEVVDDDLALGLRPIGPLLQVAKIDRDALVITFKKAADIPTNLSKHPMLRRWDQRAGDPKQGGLQLNTDGTISIAKQPKNGWFTLEDGVQVQFQPDQTFATGDYWLIAARTETGDVEWPREPDPADPNKSVARALPARGAEHHYAPLGLITVNADSVVELQDDCRCLFSPLACISDAGYGEYYYSYSFGGQAIGPDMGGT